MKLKHYLYIFFASVLMASCHAGDKNKVPVVGFVDAVEDATLAQARTGFVDALKKNGFSEEQKTVKIEYRNAQNNPPTLIQIVNYFVSQKVDVLATCTTLASLTAVQRNQTIPIFEMVSPTPARMGVVGADGKIPANLFGTVEDLAYIDTSFTLIPKLVKPKHDKLTVGMVYNEAEPQSADAVARIKSLAGKLNVNVVTLPLNASADAQLVTGSLLNKDIDVFFALPDNVVFAAFETIVKDCDQHHVPVFTSEAGLVKLGAVAAFGADMYQWGYQSGEQAALYLKTHNTEGLKPEMVKVRKRVYNPDAAKKYNISIPSNFEAVK